MILDLLLRNKIWIIGFLMVFIFSNIVSAEIQLGCCVGSTLQGNYCAPSSFDDCITKINGNDIGSWLGGNNYYNLDFTCNLNGEYADWCSKNICCIVDGRGTYGITKIECADKNGEIEIGNCRSDVINLGKCLVDNKCEDGETKESCELINGVFYGGESALANCKGALSLINGCIINGNICRAGTSDQISVGETFETAECATLTGICTNCGSFVGKCDSNGQYEENSCGDYRFDRKCNEFEYCDAEGSGRCKSNDCDSANHPLDTYISWCDIEGGSKDPSIEFPRERHYLKFCDRGEIKPYGSFYCGEFRESVCKEEMNANLGKIKAECVLNDWSSCFSITDKDVCDDDYFCIWKNNECVPKFPPGFEFWSVNENIKIEDTAHGTSEMCSKITEESCKRSGDCEGGSGIAPKEEVKVEKNLLTDCGYVCCGDNKFWNTAAFLYFGDIKKAENCNEDYLRFVIFSTDKGYCGIAYNQEEGILAPDCSTDFEGIYCKKGNEICKTA